LNKLMDQIGVIDKEYEEEMKSLGFGMWRF
jgi:hypothetical protein